MIYELSQEPTIANHFLAELRDVKVQEHRARFRYNMERLGEILSYEISKSFEYTPEHVTTPLGTASMALTNESIVIIPVLRAALPFYIGFLRFFEKADSGFVGAYRATEGSRDDIDISFLYMTTPPIQDRILILVDPMLATGKSFVTAARELVKKGNPKKMILASVIAAPEGIEFIKNELPDINPDIYTINIDDHLNEKAYIVPGLGDAGDLSFGQKL